MCSVTQSRLTLCTLWTVADQAPLSWGFSWQEYGNGLPFPLPGDFPGPGTLISCIFFFAGEVFTTEPLPLGKGHDRDYLGLKRVFFLKEMDKSHILKLKALLLPVNNSAMCKFINYLSFLLSVL